MTIRYKANENLIALINALANKDHVDDLIEEAENKYKYEDETELYIAAWESKDGEEYTIALTELYFDERNTDPIEYGKWYNLADLTASQIEEFVGDAGFCFCHNVLWTRSSLEPDERGIKGGFRGRMSTKIGCIYSDGRLEDSLGDTIATAGNKPNLDSEQIWIKALE